MQQADDLILRIDSEHNDLLTRIDDLDQKILQVLQDWSTTQIIETSDTKTKNAVYQ
ncbi:MAG: hypothetical protein Q4C95_12000 [Planctomycetia bacterium]|nr:hypothetical protein [Planctomycetia bacterium]